jgi:hypothetical protein
MATASQKTALARSFDIEPYFIILLKNHHSCFDGLSMIGKSSKLSM